MYYVYVIKNAQGKHYIGSTGDIATRLKQHNGNCVTATKHRGPYALIYREQFDAKTEARKRELEIKRYKGNSKFRKLCYTSPSSSLV